MNQHNDQKLKAAVIGVGYLGRFHAQKFQANPHVDLVAVVDTDSARATEVADEVSAFLDLCDARYLVISNSTFSLTAAHISRINHPDRLLIQPHYWLANQLNHLSID